MSRQIQEIFNECIERLRQGDSVENCLMRYPEVASELELLLRTAMNVNWRASMVQPRPEFKYQARYRFINAQYAAAQEEEARSRPTLFSLQRAWVPALGLVLLLIFSSVGTAAAAANSMPDEPLYPVKIATEQVRLTLAISDEVKAELNVKFVETRSQEIVAMATKGKPEQVAIATARLEQNLDAAEVAINKIEETKARQVTSSRSSLVPPAQPIPVKPLPPSSATSSTSNRTKDNTTGAQAGDQKVTSLEADKLRNSLKANITKNLAALQNAEDKAQDKTREALRRAIEITKNKELNIQQPTRLQNKDTNVVPARPLPLDTLPKPPFQGTRGSDIKPPTNVIPGIKVNPPPPIKGSTNIVPDTSKSTTNSGTTTIVK